MDKQLITSLPNKPTYRVSEVAYYYSVTPRTVYTWIKNGVVDVKLTPLGQKRITRESLSKMDKESIIK
jgi:predicted site-specific integrase-resolvase